MASADRRLSTPRAQWLSVTLATAAVFALRLPTATARPTGGIDYGHYLATAHWLMGREPTQFGNEGLFGYHFFLAALMLVMPETTATAVSGPLVAAALLPAGFFLARRAMPPLPALACGGLLSLMQNISEMIAWGGNPNLIAMAFSMVMWRYLLQTVQAAPTGSGWRRPAMLTGLFLGLTLFTHSFSAFIALLTVAAFLVLGVGSKRLSIRALVRPSAYAGAVAALVAAPAAPLYLTLVTQGVLGPNPSPGDPLSPLLASLQFLHRDTPLLWLGAWGLALAATVVLVARRDLFGMYLAAAFGTPLVLAATVLSSHVPRTLYFLDAPLALGLGAAGLLVWKSRSEISGIHRALRRPAVAAVAVAFLLLVPPSTVYRESLAMEFYNRLTVDHVAAFDWIRGHSNSSDAVWTDGSLAFDAEGRAGETFGFWIEGYGRRPALYTARPEDLAFAYQQDAARDACRVFQSDRGAEDGIMRVGVGANLSVPNQPTIALAAGLDYEVVVAGADLGLEAGASTFLLSHGLRSNASQLQQTSDRVWLNDSATFAAPNNWSGGANASLELAASAAMYRVEGYSDGFELPWIHKDFHVSPNAQLVSREPGPKSPNQTLHFQLPPLYGSPDARFSVSVDAQDPASTLAVNWWPTSVGGDISVVVSGSAARPILVVTFVWDDPRAPSPAPGAMRLFSAAAILEARNVRFLYLEAAQAPLVTRFDVQPALFRRVYENSAIVVFEFSRRS